MTVLNKGAMFPMALESAIFSKVKGHSSLARLSNQEALPFVGKDIFTFNTAKGLQIVGEGETKADNEGAVTPVAMQPIKVVYQMRVSDEFMYASEEYRLNVLETFADGFAKKLGEGLDKMAMHGVNPFSGTASSVIGTNHMDAKVTNVVNLANIDEDIDSAVALVEASGYDVNGIALSTTGRSALASLKTADGARLFPELAFGGKPEALGAMKLDINSTVAADTAIVGDFEDAFRWGIAKELPLETIQYGNPDGQGDLKQYNQIVLRSEAYIGWAILDPSAFAIVK